MLPATLQFLIVMIASSINERMQKQLDYKTEEAIVIKEILRSVTGKSRIDFNEIQRKRLAIRGKELSLDARLSPGWIELPHIHDELPDIRINSRAATPVARFESPVGAEAPSVPADYSIGLD